MSPAKYHIRQSIAGFLILLGVILLTGSLVLAYTDLSTASRPPARLPEAIAGLTLKTASYGPDAVAQITRLHGKDVRVETGAIGIYGEGDQVTLWIADFPSRAEAEQITGLMTEKIELGNSPFTPADEVQPGGRSVYFLDGMGQKHIYFQSGNLVIWLAAAPAFAEQAIQQILEAYP